VLFRSLQAAQRQEAIGQLAAGVAHDFNNLLSAIGASADMARSMLAPGHGAVAHLDRVSGATRSAARLVRQLLSLGGRERRAVRLDLGEVLHEAADLLRAGVPARIAVGLDPPGSPVTLEADPTDLLQVILNFGINGRDAIGTAAGEITLRARIETAPDTPPAPAVGRLAGGRRYAVLEVADTGAGIPPDRRESIFRPYVSTKGTEGTGLGLAVVSSIAQHLDGAVTLDSREGAGSTFRLHLPLSAADAPPPPAPPATGAGDASVLAGRPVLVCDDIPEVGQSLAALLEAEGAEVAVCQDPRDALEAIADSPGAWALLLTDFDMPEMDGAALAAAVRRIAPELPILLCTALAEGRRQAAVFDALLSKPVTREALVASVSAATARRGHHAETTGVADA